MRLVWLFVLVASLAACAPKPEFRGTDIHQETFGGPLKLTDHNGVKRSLADFRGRLVVLFFGYVHCPDVCPTTLSDMAKALKKLTPAEAARVQVIFVSVDPERDTPQLLREFVPYFHPDFLSMTGSAAEVAQAAKDFRVKYNRHIQPGVDGYLVDHTAGSYVLDKAGKLRLFLPFAMSPDDIAHDLRAVLSED